ncbi:MAG TPA: hypothetical protein VIW73_03745 [Candidatus Cybelea sp.]
MPKRLMIVLTGAALVLAIAACHSSSVAPTPSGSPLSPSPNPSITKAIVLVTILGTPAPKIPVQISTPKNTASPRPGTPFQTKRTNKKGKVLFNDLKPSKTYCWVAILAPGHTSSECAGWSVWQTSIITLGT